MNEIQIAAIELRLHRLDTAVEELRLRLRGLESRVSRSPTSEALATWPLLDSPQISPYSPDQEPRISTFP